MTFQVLTAQLGHIALQYAKAMGADFVAVITTHFEKSVAARQLGADEVIISTNSSQMKKYAKTFHHILSTIPVPFDLAIYLALLRQRGTITVMGLLGPYKQILNNIDLAARGLSLTGSMIGSVAETKECLEFCRKHSILPQVEVIEKENINEAIERLKVADVRFRLSSNLEYDMFHTLGSGYCRTAYLDIGSLQLTYLLAKINFASRRGVA